MSYISIYSLLHKIWRLVWRFSFLWKCLTSLRSTARQCLIVLAEKSLLSKYWKSADMIQNNWQDLFSDSCKHLNVHFGTDILRLRFFVAVGFCSIFLRLFWMTIWYSSLFVENKISHPTESEDAVNGSSRMYYCGVFYSLFHLVYSYCLSVSMANSVVFKSVEQTKTTVISSLSLSLSPLFFFNLPVFNYRVKQSQNKGRIFLVIFIYKLCLVIEFLDFIFLYDWSL